MNCFVVCGYMLEVVGMNAAGFLQSAWLVWLNK
jgi:hypothetical protein